MRATDWNEIAAFYEGLPETMDWKPKLMAVLVRQIANSRYGRSLYAATSMHMLCIGQTPEIEYKRNMLSAELAHNKIQLEYWDTSENGKRWRRLCNPEDAFAVFEKFCASLHWFTE
jgi:hypothetical protein